MIASITVLAGGAVAVWIVTSLRIDENSPLPRMYRTETDLVALVNAVEMYHNTYGLYPPAGESGLKCATDQVSKHGRYFPDGPPLDAWNRPFIFAPVEGYATEGSNALSEDGVFFSPTTFQLYSRGADGLSGIGGTVGRQDNITSWNSSRSWRRTYQVLQEMYEQQSN